MSVSPGVKAVERRSSAQDLRVEAPMTALEADAHMPPAGLGRRTHMPQHV